MKDENDKLKIDIQRVLQVFTQNEMGNKVTQFNMMGLTNMVMGVIDGTVVVKQQGQQPVRRPVETHRVDLPEPKKELPKMAEAEQKIPEKLEDLEPEVAPPVLTDKPVTQPEPAIEETQATEEVIPEPETARITAPEPEIKSDPKDSAPETDLMI